MSRLETQLPTVIKDMQVNYITLTRTCNKLVQSIKTVLQRQFGIQFPVLRLEGDSNDHGVLYVILHILIENKASYNIHRKSKDKSPFKGGVEIIKARDTFEEFFNAHLHLLLT